MRKSSSSLGPVRRYLGYAIGEIVLVMIGILLAVQVNEWNNNRLERVRELGVYEKIKNQLNGDKGVIEGTIEYNSDYTTQFKTAVQIIESNDRTQIDTLSQIALNTTKYSDFDKNSNIYESLVNNGEITLLTNEEVVRGLQRLEETYTYFNRMEEVHYDIITSSTPKLIEYFKYSTRSMVRPNDVYSYQFQNILILFLEVMKEKDTIYQRAIEEIESIISSIDTELNS